MKQLLGKIANTLTLPVKVKRFELLKEQGLPIPISAALSYLIHGNGGTAGVIQEVEEIREDMKKAGDQLVEILYSPKPGSSGHMTHPEIRPEPGARLNFSMERVALTGKNKTWGTVLYLLARESKAKTILELGSCAGISAAYLSASEHCEVLHTIEGSAALSRLAQETLKKLNRKAIVHNALFDDALDDILPEIEFIDLAFIDGHHEKVATIHYWERIASKTRPGSVIIFDDIAWSQDMRDAWIYLSKQPAFCDAADFGPIGVCICGEQTSVNETHYWDFQNLLGKQQVGQPHGWSRKEGDIVS